MFYDRLVDDSDRSWLIEQARATMSAHLGEDFDVLFKHLKTHNDATQVGNLRRRLAKEWGEH